jgi:hypothetical protein
MSYLGIRPISSLKLATFVEIKKHLMKIKTMYVEVRKPNEEVLQQS